MLRHWDAGKQFTGGGSGIRTHGTLARTHAFQACALSRSAIPPRQVQSENSSPLAGGKPLPRRLYTPTLREPERITVAS
jgi:hypothetical protein